MSYLPLICVTLIVISAIFVAIGWFLIAQTRRNMKAHQFVMTIAAALALLFFIMYALRTILLGNTAFGGPDTIKPYYTGFLIFHILLATSGGVLGLMALFFAYKKNFTKHRKIGPKASVIWFLTAITGVIVYCLLYVVYEPGETTNVFRAIWNH
ncbi:MULTISPECIES: DUF420 domain-containing protein [Exiguobacterium]|uniref:DUF420 domain-containing protein n=1 Tax=Exiguobacterium antarcticum TaxID=132920 RepID=A0ABT6QYI2_9BACL|nr:MULTISPECIES: DUF420 domain-containing protein [Exiguobacterium]AFS70942.1 Hypothetical protein Eab7_1834 [Exiguobacterium antarcticum B7]MCT4779117.1 DUF420 domain-containing protein [Exiguobacterium soli]MDI3233745.1 DUF420 domain-containing protein [Exiguobacterium antarcticum]